jgi:two-component system, OmpR family, sensor histidine kinase BaeS
MTAGDLAQRVPVRGSDELATLARTFNSMAASLQGSEERRQAMTADIAHELRNPLSVQRAYLEALQDGIYPVTPENLQPVLDQNILLSRLVEDLRTLALADAGELKLEKTEVDVNSLVACVLERFKLLAENRRIVVSMNLEKTAGQSPKVWGDPLRLEQILSNLMSNALRYTPEGGSIAVGISPVQDRVEIGVHDSGPGIPQEALPHVFERFYRADRSRSRDEGGSGLGLAIARQLALAHGGELMAANDPRGGALFILRLPCLMRGEGLAAK